MSNEANNKIPRRLSRRRFVQEAGAVAVTIGAGGALAGCGSDETPQTVPTDTNATQFPPVSPTSMPPNMVMPPGTQMPVGTAVTSYFTRDEATAVDAVVGRLIPGDADDPGAREANVANFIDTKLARFQSFAAPTYFDAPFAKPVARPPGPQEQPTDTILVQDTEIERYGFQGSSTPQKAYRDGIEALNTTALARHGQEFAKLDSTAQDGLLALAEAGEIQEWANAAGFFKMILEDTYEGMFADPSYGGNRDLVGWKLVGYPGAQRAYTPDELINGPQNKKAQGMLDMPGMNPGIPQDHVILPIQGTRPEKDG